MRLLVHVEGQTEETFVEVVLAPHLRNAGYADVSATLMGNAERRSGRGGSRSWLSVRQRIVRHLRRDRNAISTTMVDYYGMQPRWPGRSQSASLPFAERAAAVQTALADDVRSEMGGDFDPARFIPYVSMHEFEALLFSDCDAFAWSVGVPEAVPKLKAVLASFGDPEQINDSKGLSPSARIQSVVEGYDKVVYGTLAVEEIGLEAIRRQCRNFGCWLTRLERAIR